MYGTDEQLFDRYADIVDGEGPLVTDSVCAGDASASNSGSVTNEQAELAERLQTIRSKITALADPAGTFIVACRDSGIRPEPITDARFSEYSDAEAGSRLAGRYRDAIRTVDPSLSQYDLVVSELHGESVELANVRELTDGRRANGLPRSRQTVTLAGNGNDEWLRVENGAVVEFTGPDSLLDDEFVTRQLDSKFADQL